MSLQFSKTHFGDFKEASTYARRCAIESRESIKLERAEDGWVVVCALKTSPPNPATLDTTSVSGIPLTTDAATEVVESFKPLVSIEHYSEDEKSNLMEHGLRLQAIMLIETEPKNEEEQHFLDMCYGKAHPINNLEALWKKYQLDVMYAQGIKMNNAIADNVYSYSRVVNYFIKIGNQGHKAALEWLEREGNSITPAAEPPLIDIARIYPRRPGKIDILDSGRMYAGSYGTAQR